MCAHILQSRVVIFSRNRRSHCEYILCIICINDCKLSTPLTSIISNGRVANVDNCARVGEVDPVVGRVLDADVRDDGGHAVGFHCGGRVVRRPHTRVEKVDMLQKRVGFSHSERVVVDVGFSILGVLKADATPVLIHFGWESVKWVAADSQVRVVV